MFTGIEQAGLHGADGNPDNSGNLDKRQAFSEKQDGYGAMVRRQLCESAIDGDTIVLG